MFSEFRVRDRVSPLVRLLLGTYVIHSRDRDINESSRVASTPHNIPFCCGVG